jgi:hypothetical protein
VVQLGHQRETAMQIIPREIVDWEPLHVALLLKRKAKPSKALADFIPPWLESRSANHICECTIKDHYVGVSPEKGRLTFSCEWMCENCLKALAEALEKQFPEVDHIEIGEDDTTPVAGPEIYRFIHISAKQVLFEDGTTASVEAFDVAKSPITIEQYEAFANATGYQTLAERQGPDMCRTYRDNELIQSKRTRGQTPAYVMAYDDAVAYCDWAGVRLPTEAEWLAASILDEGIYEHDEALQVLRRLRRRGDALEFGGNDWTSTPAGPDHMIVRCEPHLVRTTDWASHGSAGIPRHRLDNDLLSTFRVCKR